MSETTGLPPATSVPAICVPRHSTGGPAVHITDCCEKQKGESIFVLMAKEGPRRGCGHRRPSTNCGVTITSFFRSCRAVSKKKNPQIGVTITPANKPQHYQGDRSWTLSWTGCHAQAVMHRLLHLQLRGRHLVPWCHARHDHATPVCVRCHYQSLPALCQASRLFWFQSERETASRMLWLRQSQAQRLPHSRAVAATVTMPQFTVHRAQPRVAHATSRHLCADTAAPIPTCHLDESLQYTLPHAFQTVDSRTGPHVSAR